jgi:hypothetical protein
MLPCGSTHADQTAAALIAEGVELHDQGLFAEAVAKNGSNSGAAYVFSRSGHVWTQQAKLSPSDASIGDGFGYSVALSDDIALVGAPTTTTTAQTPAQPTCSSE